MDWPWLMGAETSLSQVKIVALDVDRRGLSPRFFGPADRRFHAGVIRRRGACMVLMSWELFGWWLIVVRTAMTFATDLRRFVMLA